MENFMFCEKRFSFHEHGMLSTLLCSNVVRITLPFRSLIGKDLLLKCSKPTKYHINYILFL